ncbi:uncharacterized protein LOC119092259 [Pollicipes pollicipes]|uniref:uncharacterized protein LOC119092259 n=1 Tax=Pollicipes pollicipes TaxID=41117 RepID=UPI001884CB56|nr:uncharacterized protein LOC119092259 [Pollicipes pollicipes]
MEIEGYCLVAEGLARHDPPPGGHWTCWLLDQVRDLSMFSNNKLIQVAACSSTFVTMEIRDYYVPRPDEVVFSYYMRAGRGHQLTLQMEASHEKALVDVQIFDNENKLVAFVEGLGQAVIPLFTLDGEDPFVPSAPRDKKRKMSAYKPPQPA